MEFNATFLVSIVSFLVFMKLMNEIFYAPLTKIIEERENIVNKNYDDASFSRTKADEILKTKEFRLTETAKQSRQIMVDKTNEANNDYKLRVDNARKDLNNRIGELKNELNNEEIDAKNVLNSQVEELSQNIVNKVLQGGANA